MTDKLEAASKIDRLFVIFLEDLKEAYSGMTGQWIVYSVPPRDERGGTYILDYYEGPFENVLKAAVKQRGFMDCEMCGKILPLNLVKV